MNVSKINNVSFQQNYPEPQKSTPKNNDYQQINVVTSKEAATALKNIALGLMVLGASVGAGNSITGCTDDINYEQTTDLPDNWVITNCGDTIVINKNEALNNYLNMNIQK